MKMFKLALFNARLEIKICMLLLLLSRFIRVWLIVTPWTAAYQPPPSMGFSRQEYWSGVPLPSLYFLLILCKELSSTSSIQGLPWWYSGWESTCQCREYGFDPWSGKIPHASKQLSLCTTATEAHVPGACGPQEKPPQWEARALQQRVAPC